MLSDGARLSDAGCEPRCARHRLPIPGSDRYHAQLLAPQRSGAEANEKDIKKIFVYLDKFFEFVQPQKLLYAVTDGTSFGGVDWELCQIKTQGLAPLAKANQRQERQSKADKAAEEVASLLQP